MNKILLRIFCLMLVAALLVPSLVGGAYALPQGQLLEAFKDRNVMDDLNDPNTMVNGKPFSELNYPINVSGDVELLSVVEFGYSASRDTTKCGLFLYIYNPSTQPIDEGYRRHKVQIATGFDIKTDEPSHYEKFTLEFCSKSEDYRFYKFYVDYNPGWGLAEREYWISGVELKLSASNAVKEYKVGGKYCFSGFAKGFGEDPTAASSLSCSVVGLDTISLDLKSTFFRTNGHESLDDTMHNQLTSVWFTIPAGYITEEQELKSIHASWTEVKTAPILVTSNKDFYAQAFLNRRYVLSTKNDKSVGYWIYGLEKLLTGTNVHYNFSYNCKDHYDLLTSVKYYGSVNQLPFVFYSAEVKDDDGVFGFLSSSHTGGVAGAEVLDYFNFYPSDTVFIYENGRAFPRELVAELIPVEKTIPLTATVSLESYKGHYSDLAAFLEYGFDYKLYQDSYSVKPFEEINLDVFGDYQGDFHDSLKIQVAQELLINESDVDELYYDVLQASSKGEKVVLFRFAKTDYQVFEVERWMEDYSKYNDSYIAKMSVFFDFDVIDLTFKNAGSFLTIPVVADPIDIAGDVQPPDDFGGGTSNDWLHRLFALLLLVILIVIIIIFFPFIGNILLAIIAFPFNVISSLIDYFKKRRR